MRCPGCGNYLSDPLDCTCPPSTDSKPMTPGEFFAVALVMLAFPVTLAVGVYFMCGV